MLLEQTIEKLTAMRLRSMAKAVKERLGRSDHSELSFAELMGLIVDDEWMARENRRLTGRVTGAKFKDRGACIEGIDFHASRGLKKAEILELAQNHWIKTPQNLIITGPTGAGKSYLSQAFGQQACRSGFNVTYLRLPKFLPSLLVHRADGSFGKITRQLARTRLLILDDWGIPSIAERERTDLLEIIEDRHGTGATIVASQLPPGSWHTYLGGGIIADSICDRLLRGSIRLELTGESRRGKPMKTTEEQ